MPKRVSKRNQQEWHLCSARSDTSRNDLLNPPASLIRCPAREFPRQNSSTDTEEFSDFERVPVYGGCHLERSREQMRQLTKQLNKKLFEEKTDENQPEETVKNGEEDTDKEAGEESEEQRKEIIKAMPFLTRVPRENVPTVLEIIQYEALSTERKLAYLEEYLTMTALRQKVRQMAERPLNENPRERTPSSSDSDGEHPDTSISKDELLNPSASLFESPTRQYLPRKSSTTTEELFSDFERVSVYGGRHFDVSDLSLDQRRALKKQLEDEVSDEEADVNQSEGETEEDTDVPEIDTESEEISEEEHQDLLKTMPFLSHVQKEQIAKVLLIIQNETLPVEKKLQKLEEYLRMRELGQCEEYLRNEEKEEGKKATSSIGSEETRDSDKMGKNVEPSEEDKQKKDDLIQWLESELKETEEALEREKEINVQLRDNLSANEREIAGLLERNAAMEEVIAKGNGSGTVKTERERGLEEVNKRKDEEIAELREQIESNQMVTAELLENMEDVRKTDVRVKEYSTRLGAIRTEDCTLQNSMTPFPFLDTVTPPTIHIIHTAIQKYTRREAAKVDSAILLFLPEENKPAYEEWKKELRSNIPMVLYCLPEDVKEQIMAFIKKNYTAKSGRKLRTLEEILEIAHNMLLSFVEAKEVENTVDDSMAKKDAKDEEEVNQKRNQVSNGEETDEEQPEEEEEEVDNEVRHEEISEVERMELVKAIPFLAHVAKENIPAVLKIIRNEASPTETKLKSLEEYLSIKALKACEEYLRNNAKLADNKQLFDKSPKTMNILLLGATGVGKSTFINNFANLFYYSNLDDAEKNGFHIAVPASFTHITPTDFQKIPISVRANLKAEGFKDVEDENECEQPGEPATQAPRSYLFEYGPEENRKHIRLIDTPGFGGMSTCAPNFAKTWDGIADFEKIDAICILLQAGQAHQSLNLRYCLNEIASHLGAPAVENIFFCFTFSRGADYSPGETYSAVRHELERRNHPIALDGRYFCFDSESFRYLCCRKNGIDINEKFTNRDRCSFDRSKKEVYRMIEAISKVEPFAVKDPLLKKRRVPAQPGFHLDNCLLLKNPSTYCFANVIVQAIYRLWRKKILNYTGENAIMLELRRIVTGQGEVDVRELLKKVSEGSHVAFDSGEQCDAQEFWTEMFNQLPEEYQRGFNIGIKKNYTCKKCGHKTSTGETNENILIVKKALAKGLGLHKYLHLFERSELIEEKTCEGCPMLNSTTHASQVHWCRQQLDFESPISYAQDIIQMHDIRPVRRISQNTQFIAVRVELRKGIEDGRRHFVDRKIVADKDEYHAFNCRWSPVVMIKHKGCEISHHGGHYVAYLRNSEGWLRIDDLRTEPKQRAGPPDMKRICFFILKRLH